MVIKLNVKIKIVIGKYLKSTLSFVLYKSKLFINPIIKYILEMINERRGNYKLEKGKAILIS